MVHPQALVEPMGLPLRPNPQKKRKTNGMKFSNRDNICGGREKVGKSNNFKNELTMFTP
jgi:hypothetical protein